MTILLRSRLAECHATLPRKASFLFNDPFFESFALLNKALFRIALLKTTV